MPDLDSGHIFLTTLAPIKDSKGAAGSRTSYEQNVRMALAKLPTAMQSPATQRTGINSPFARNKRNHLARMFVLNDVVFNGRVGQNALVAAITGDDPLVPQHVDRLNASYLVFCAEVDAVTEDGAPLPTTLTAAEQKKVRAAYARELWETMAIEIQDIYCNCVGFEGVETADQFAEYLDKCHVETTMPFHDYYLKLPEFHNLPLKPLIYGVAAPAIVALLALVMRIFGMATIPFVGWSTLCVLAVAIALTALFAALAVRYAIKNGEKPLAPGEYDDLPSVLKALYTQQKFSDFVVDHQGADADALHAGFGAFLEQTRPSRKSGPTQPPGVISAAATDVIG